MRTWSKKKIVLADIVWSPHRDEFIENLRKELGGNLGKIDCIIVNHGEQDHSGSLSALLKEIPDTPIYCTAAAMQSLEGQYGKRGNEIFRQYSESVCTFCHSQAWGNHKAESAGLISLLRLMAWYGETIWSRCKNNKNKRKWRASAGMDAQVDIVWQKNVLWQKNDSI